MEWAAFERVFGPLTLHERTDTAAALIGTVVARSAGDKRIRPEDLMPRWDGGERDIDEGFAALLRMAEKNG